MIFVTGGTGFLGRHLLAKLCQQGEQVRVLTRHAAQHAWLSDYPNVTVIEGDLRNNADLSAALQGCQQVIHAAAKFSMWGREEEFQQTNVEGTQRLIEAAVRAGVQRLVYVSTIAVIGTPTPNRLIDEQHPARPADAYQASKLRAESVVLEAHKAGLLAAVVVRPGAFYGPLGDYAFNRLFFTDPMRGIIMQMDGGRYIQFPVFISDVVQGILLALAQGRGGEIYNICGECLSHRQVFDIVCREAGLRYPRLNIPKWLGIGFSHVLEGLSRLTGREPFYPINLRSYVFNDWQVSSAKAERELGFVPTPFAEGAAQTVAWHRQGRVNQLESLRCD
jgi:dihydroflavonol-4-reductase